MRKPLVLGVGLLASLVLLLGALGIWVQARDARSLRLGARAGKVLRRSLLRGFDPAGEPELIWFDRGGIALRFSQMPPSFAVEPDGDDLGDWASFDRELELALGVEVRWEDRETFFLPQPADDTPERLARFLAGYRPSATAQQSGGGGP